MKLIFATDSNSSGNNSILGSLNSLGDGMDKSRLPSPRIMFISLFLMAPFILFIVMLLYYYFIGHCNIICNSWMMYIIQLSNLCRYTNISPNNSFQPLSQELILYFIIPSKMPSSTILSFLLYKIWIFSSQFQFCLIAFWGGQNNFFGNFLFDSFAEMERSNRKWTVREIVVNDDGNILVWGTKTGRDVHTAEIVHLNYCQIGKLNKNKKQIFLYIKNLNLIEF